MRGGSKKGRKVVSGENRKKHTFKRKNAKGNNDTHPILFTDVFLLRELKRMLRALKKDLVVAGGHHIYYKSQLFTDTAYSSHAFVRSVESNRNEKISLCWSKVNEILEGRIWVGGLKGYLNAALTKFLLINCYGAREIAKVEVTGRTEHTLLMREIIKKSKEE